MSETFTPDNLVIPGVVQVTDDKTLKISAGALVRGQVMGKITKGAVAAAAAAGGGEAGANTGNGTCTIDATTPKLAGAKPGTYHVEIIRAAVAQVGTTPAVPAQKALGALYDPDGNLIDTFEIDASGGTAKTVANQIKFAIISGNTAFAVGDGFDIVIAAGSGQVAAYDSTAVDGTEEPDSILLEDKADDDATQAALCALSGEFSEGALVFAHSGDAVAAIKDKLRAKGIFTKATKAAA